MIIVCLRFDCGPSSDPFTVPDSNVSKHINEEYSAYREMVGHQSKSVWMAYIYTFHA